MDPETERKVVAGLRRGEVAAFDRAYQAWRPRIYSFLMRLGRRRDLAEDLLQDTFLRLAARGRTLAEDTRLGPWLFTVARNLYVSHRRASLLDADRMQELWLRDEAARITPFEELAGTELQRRLERALAAMPENYREVVLLVVVERMNRKDTAAILGLRPDALRQRLARALGMLQAALEEPPVKVRSIR